MKKIYITLLILVCTLILGGRVNALEPLTDPLVNPVVVAEEKPEPKPKPVIKKPKPATYVIKQNDTLVKIARKYKTLWQRLYYKNKSIKHPDLIKENQKIIIPTKKEKLKHRKLPRIALRATYKPSGGVSGSTAGNTYTYGYCTWYVKNQLSWIPNGWHNADTWGYYARQQGFYVGSKPKVGAVAWSASMHVAVVIGVGKGTVTVSEMNYKGWNKVSTRTTPVGYWTGYIY